MVSEFSSFAITGYYNTKAPPEVAGDISQLLCWYEGLDDWQPLPGEPLSLPKNTALHLASSWLNLSAEPISGHIQLTVIKPDGSKVTPTDVLNQNNWADPGNGYYVQFEPVLLDQTGEYQAKVILSSMGQTLDERAFAVATVTAQIEITSIVINPTSLTDAKHEYQTYLGLGYWGDPFTISITISNPYDYDVWVRPDYAFGKLTGDPLRYVGETLDGFTPYPLLYFRLLLDIPGYQGDYSYFGNTWQKLYHYQNLGSNMSQYVYDPDGNAVLAAGADCWLKVPAKGEATTVKEGHLGIEDHDLLPDTFDFCTVVTAAFYLVWDPHYRTVGGKRYLINYSSVALDPSAAAVPGAVYIERTV